MGNISRNIMTILLLLSVESFAIEMERIQFVIQGKAIEFTWFKEQAITISSNCVNKGTIKKCKAKTALDSVGALKKQKEFLGRNPGALLCAQQLGGTVVWAKDKNNNERTFCKFDDNSFVGSGSLSFHANKNSQ